MPLKHIETLDKIRSLQIELEMKFIITDMFTIHDRML